MGILACPEAGATFAAAARIAVAAFIGSEYIDLDSCVKMHCRARRRINNAACGLFMIPRSNPRKLFVASSYLWALITRLPMLNSAHVILTSGSVNQIV